MSYGPLPSNVEAEKGLLSCLMLDPTYMSIAISSKLEANNFYEQTHWMIYEAMLDLFYEGKTMDYITIWEALKKRWNFYKAWGDEYLLEIAAFSIWTSGFLEYLKVVIEKWKLRMLISSMGNMTAKAYWHGSSDEIMDTLRMDYYKFLWANSLDKWGSTLEEAYDTLIQSLEEWWLKPICHTWYKELDDYVWWFTETAVWVIWARSSHWKSTLALNFLINAIQQWVWACLFTLEVDRSEIAQKAASILWWIPSQAYKAEPTPELIARMKEEREKRADALKRLVIFDKINRYEHICNEIYAQASRGTKVFCVDHIILVQSQKKSWTSARDIWDIVNWFKQIAQELNVCIILISQFNRDLDKRILQEPRMSDFNGSSDIENIANVALWLWRPEFGEKDDCAPELKGILQVYLLKNRWGMVKNTPINLWCDMALGRVWSLSKEEHLRIENPAMYRAMQNTEKFDIDSIDTFGDSTSEMPF